MRWLPLVALAACSSTTSSNGIDSGLDAKQFVDARSDGTPRPDAYAPRACDAPLTFADGFVPTRIIHVTAGAIYGDGSLEFPFGSIAAAAAAATPGTFIQVAVAPNGTQHGTNQFIANLHGTPDAPIVIGGIWGTLPEIVGGSEGLHLTDPRWVVIQNLHFSNQAANAINIDDGVSYSGTAGPVAIVNVVAHDVQDGAGACIRAAGVANLYVYNSRLLRCSTGIDAIGVHDSVIARDELGRTTQSAVRVRGGSHDVDIRQNTIVDGGTTGISLGGYTQLAQFRPALSTTSPNAEARNIRAFDNVITGQMTAAIAFDDCVDCLVAHNVVHGNPNMLLRILQNATTQGSFTFEPTGNGRVINNSFNWSSINLLRHVEVGFGTSASTFTFSHNLWNCADQPSQSQPSLPVTEDMPVIGIGTGYYPGPSGPYCGGPEAGKAAPLPEVDGTIEGYCRAAGDAPTIGPQMLQSGTVCGGGI